MTEIAAVELGQRRINVNAVIPGITDTPCSRRCPCLERSFLITVSLLAGLPIPTMRDDRHDSWFPTTFVTIEPDDRA
jgi:hypothetical protein